MMNRPGAAPTPTSAPSRPPNLTQTSSYRPQPQPPTVLTHSNSTVTPSTYRRPPFQRGFGSQHSEEDPDFPALGATLWPHNGGGGTAAWAPQQQLREDDFPALGDTAAGSGGGGGGGHTFGGGGGGAVPGMLNIGGVGAGRGTYTMNKPNGHQQQQQQNAPPPSAQPQPLQQQNPNPNPTPANQPANTQVQSHPRTPAQQVLVSAADRWGLLGLLVSIKSAGHDSDDLGTMGLDMGFDGNLYSTFITPWSDQSAARSVEPDYVIPACYNVVTAPPGPSKVTGFSDETLFFMFYSSPRDALQEVAAQELWNRNWRFHKTLRMWITKETGMVPSHKVPGGESGQYHVWDAELWAKERRDMTVMYAELEEKNAPAFMPGPALHLAQQGVGVGQQQGAVPVGVVG